MSQISYNMGLQSDGETPSTPQVTTHNASIGVLYMQAESPLGQKKRVHWHNRADGGHEDKLFMYNKYLISYGYSTCNISTE